MPYDVSWLVDERIVYAQVLGVLNPTELSEMTRTVEGLINTGNPPVHFITDNTLMEKMDFGLKDIPNLVKRGRAEGQGWFIMVSPGRADRFISSIVSQMINIPAREFATLQEAAEFLSHADETLPVIEIPADIYER